MESGHFLQGAQKAGVHLGKEVGLNRGRAGPEQVSPLGRLKRSELRREGGECRTLVMEGSVTCFWWKILKDPKG